LCCILIFTEQTNAQSQFSYNNVDSCEYISFSKNKIYMVGELHEVVGTYDSYIKLISQIPDTLIVRVIVERSKSFAYMINQTFENPSITYQLERISNIPMHSQAEKLFYLDLIRINERRVNKIFIDGIDIEYQLEYKHFLSFLSSLITSESNNDRSIFYKRIISLHDESISKKNFTNSIGYIKREFTSKPNFYEVQIMKVILNYLRSIEIEKYSYLKWPREREKLLKENFETSIDYYKYYIGIIGVAHLPNNKYYPAFLKKISSGYSIQYLYPIYFNKYVTAEITKDFYVEHPNKKIIKRNSSTFHYFNSNKGCWIGAFDKDYFLIISN